ncbi:MAG: GNAT family N-acetyltransferase [Planctomycetota bacterium]
MSTADARFTTLCGRAVRGRTAVLELGKAWDDLAARARAGPPFAARCWAQPWIEAGRLRGAPVAITVWYGEQLVGLLAIAVRSIATIRIGEPIGTGFPCYLGALLDPAHAEAAAHLAETIVREDVVDALRIDDLSSLDSATAAFLAQLEQHGFRTRQTLRNPCLFIALRDSYDAYLLANKSSKSRGNLRRLEARLKAIGAVEVLHFVGDRITPAVMQRVAAIQNDSWIRERGAAVLADPFYQELTLSAARAGLAHVWLVTIDGEDAAFVYALVSHDQLHYVWTSFRLAFEPLSVGRVLTSWTIKDACEMHLRSYDFGHGEAEYKHFWSTDSHEVRRAVAGRGWRGRLVVFAYRLTWRLAQTGWLRSRYRQVRRWLRSLRRRSATQHVPQDAQQPVFPGQAHGDDQVREERAEPR